MMLYADLIERYIALRQKKKALVAEHETQVRILDGAMERIEGALLEEMQKNGLQSMPTPSGTAYQTRRVYVNVADGPKFLDFVRDNALWHLMEHRANKTAVEEYRATNDDLPPGINWREEIVVNVRAK